MAIVNVTENLARNILQTNEIQRLMTCTCQACQDDVLAIALNHLPAKYVATDKGSLFVKADYMRPQMQSDFLTALIHAAEMVSQRPHHAAANQGGH